MSPWQHFGLSGLTNPVLLHFFYFTFSECKRNTHKRTNTCSENQGKCQRMRSGIAVLVMSHRKDDQVLHSLTPAATSWLEGSVASITRQARLRSAGGVSECVCVCVWTLVGSVDSMFRQRRISIPKRWVRPTSDNIIHLQLRPHSFLWHALDHDKSTEILYECVDQEPELSPSLCIHMTVQKKSPNVHMYRSGI
jgi:hypothetical protein